MHPLGHPGAEGVTRLRLGRACALGRGTTLELHAHAVNELALGDEVTFGHGTRIQLRGGTLRLGPRSNVRDWVTLRSSGELVTGTDVPISSASFVHCSAQVVLEDLAGVAERVSILDTDHTPDGSDEHFYRRPLRVDPVHVGRNTFVGAGAVLLCGARLGRNCVVGANAVVPAGDYPDGHLVAGVPARAVRRLG